MTEKLATGGQVTVTFTTQEAQILAAMLNEEIGNTRVEVHHTHTSGTRNQIIHREEILKEILQKLM